MDKVDLKKSKKSTGISSKGTNKALKQSWIYSDWAVLFGYLIILIILFYQIFFLRMDFSQPDAVSASQTAQGLNYHFSEEGIYPLWNPYIFSGMPSLPAMSFVRFIYFPSIILTPVWLLGIPSIITMIFHYLLAGFGTYLLLRRWKLDKISSFFGGVVFMMMPYLITMLAYGHGSQMMCSVYIPIILYAIDRLFEKPSLRNMGLAALLIGFQLQRAHVQIVYFTWMLIGAYYIYKLIVDWKSPDFKKKILPMTGCFLGALVLGFGLAAVLYLPVHDYTPYSIRGGAGGGTGFDYATQWSFHPKEMMTFLIPSYYGFGGITYWGTMPFTDYPNYMGIVVLILAILTLTLKFRKVTLFFTIIWGLSLFISFGKHFFLYGLFYNILPYFNKFRVPSMMLIVTQFSTAILAGFGLHDLIELFKSDISDQKQKRIRTVIYVVGAIVGILALYLLFFQSGFKESMFAHFKINSRLNPAQIKTVKNMQFDMLYKDFWIMIIFLGISCFLIYLALKQKISAKLMGISLLCLTIIDLYVVDAKIIQPKPRVKKPFQLKDDPAAEFLKKDKDLFRIFPANELFGDKHWMAYRIQTIGGYHAAKMKIYQEFIERTGFKSLGLLRMLNVKYLISTKRFRSPEFDEVVVTNTIIQSRRTPVAIYKLKDFLPRAFFAKNVIVIGEKDYIINELNKPDFDPTELAILEKTLTLTIEQSDSQTVNIIDWGIHKMTFDVFTEKTSQLVVSEVYYPNGWKAYIDGHPTEIYKTNYILRSISVPSGKHTVVIRYAPSDIFIGLTISLISLAIVVTILIVYRKRR